MEQLDSVHDLRWRNRYVDHLEVLLQPVPDEDTPGVDEVPQFEVRVLQFHDVVLSERGI